MKIERVKKKNPGSPYFVEIPDALKTLSFLEKDSKPSVTGSECGYMCHARVASNDYIFTAYPPR